MRFAHEMLSQITLEVCGSILGLERVRVTTQPEVDLGVDCLEGRIRITGEWDLELRIVCPKPSASQLASELFNISELDVTDADMKDAFGEAVNVIGTNVKSVLGGECHLSYPRIQLICSDHKVEEADQTCEFVGDVLTVHLADATAPIELVC